MNEKNNKKISILLLIATAVLAFVALVLAMCGATPVTDIANKLMLKDLEITEIAAIENAHNILNAYGLWVGIISVLMAIVTFANVVISLIKKNYTLGFLTFAIMEVVYAVIFALEPVRFSAYFDIAFWALVIQILIDFVFIIIDIIRRTFIDVEYRKRAIILIIIGAADIVLSTIFFFLFGDRHADYVEGMLRKYDISMSLYAVVSIFAYGVYTIVFGALLAIAASLFMKSNKKR